MRPVNLYVREEAMSAPKKIMREDMVMVTSPVVGNRRIPINTRDIQEVMSASKQTAKLVTVAEPVITTQSEPDYNSSSDDNLKTNTTEGGNKKIILFSVIGVAVLAIAVTGYFAFRK